MFDRLFAPLLTFTLLIAATLAIGIAMVEEGRSSTTQQASADIITMPAVTITGKRVQSVAEATQALRTTME
jgi:hypothetical protein